MEAATGGSTRIHETFALKVGESRAKRRFAKVATGSIDPLQALSKLLDVFFRLVVCGECSPANTAAP